MSSDMMNNTFGLRAADFSARKMLGNAIAAAAPAAACPRNFLRVMEFIFKLDGKILAPVSIRKRKIARQIFCEIICGTEMTRSFHVLTKPVGPICNLDCKYCFYLEKEKLYPDETQWR